MKPPFLCSVNLNLQRGKRNELELRPSRLGDRSKRIPERPDDTKMNISGNVLERDQSKTTGTRLFKGFGGD